MIAAVSTLDDLQRAMLGLPASDRWGAITILDEANSPTLDPGDVLAVDLAVRRWECDGVYVVEVDGEPLVRRVAMQGDGLRVWADNPAVGEASRGVAVADLTILGRVTKVAGWKEVRLP